MVKAKIGIPVLVLLVLSCGSSQRAEMFNRQAAEPASMPEKVMESLSLKKGDTVIDLGAGGGYYTLRIAGEVGGKGTVYAADIDPDFLEYIRITSKNAGFSNVRFVLADEKGVNVPEKSVDLVFIRNVYHHLKDRIAYFNRLKSVLKQGGRIAVIDHLDSGLIMKIHGHTSDPHVVESELNGAGLRLVQQHDFLKNQFFLVFQE